MLGQTPLPCEKAPLPLQVAADEASQGGASQRGARLLWTGFGLTVLMLLGVSACAFHSLASHSSAEPSSLDSQLAFNPTLIGLRGSAVLPGVTYVTGRPLPRPSLRAFSKSSGPRDFHNDDNGAPTTDDDEALQRFYNDNDKAFKTAQPNMASMFIGGVEDNADAFKRIPRLAGNGDAVDTILPPIILDDRGVSDLRLVPYKLDKEIGRGSYGKVFQMSDWEEDTKWALKITPKVNVPKCALEVELQKLVQPNPHVVKIVDDWINSHGDEMVVMEFLKDGTLGDKVGPAGLGPPHLDVYQPQAIFRQLAKGVQLLHLSGVVHRDLKPSNVVCDESTDPPTVKIIDFGAAAKFTPGAAALQGRHGTVEYSAPETLSHDLVYGKRIDSAPYIGPAVDVWSLGVMLYKCLSGKLPFPPSNSRSMVIQESDPKRAIQDEYPKLPGRVSESAKNLVDGMLERDPAKRLTIEQVLAHPYLSSAGT